jgi:predicted CXXCH cytochrome family protein
MRPRPGTLVLGILVASLFLGSFALRPAAAAHPTRLRIYAPGDGAVLPPGKALIVGAVPSDYGAPTVSLDVNGKVTQEVPVKGGVFTTSIYLTAGKNVLTAKAGDQTVTMAILASENAVYRYHPDVEKCAECHADTAAGYSIPGPKDKLCYKCHDRLDVGKFLHGPMGTGECNACHNPHGSGQASLVVSKPDALCTTCHDQKSSESHVKKAAGKECVACHDPHSGANQQLLKAVK